MKIFLDTNIFYNNWFMKNASFKYLFHFLNNESHELILSKLVIEETENIRSREIAEYISEVEKNLKKAQKLNLKKIPLSIENIDFSDYDLLSLIKERVEHVDELDYEDITHSEVVSRVFLNKKPFIEGEKGYRDTLIWLSFIKYLVKNDIDEEVVFITENKSDFFKVRNNIVSFHKDLDDDIKEKKVIAKIKPYTSLFNFVNSTIDKDEHAIDKFKSEEVFEPFIEESSSEFLEGMSNSDLSEYLENSVFETDVRTILGVRVEIFEGLEDPEFMNTHRLDGNDVYISYRYNLRGVVLEVDIPEMDYVLNKSELDKIFIENEVGSDIATLSCYVRPFFDVSFIYNTRDDTFKDYEVAELWLKRS